MEGGGTVVIVPKTQESTAGDSVVEIATTELEEVKQAESEGETPHVDPIPSCPPSTPTKLENEKKVKEVPQVFSAFPRFKVTWDTSVPSPLSPGKNREPFNLGSSGLMPISLAQEMTPETTLIEFIATSASFHGVKKVNMKQLEWDVLKVFVNNIMPANAAAWYMAKRRFYLDKAYQYQLLPFLLRNYPRKFQVKSNMVEFLESYNKEVARKKLQYMIHQGLYAYFSHKVDEYGVYFFDPYYYENTEPFHANLRQVTNCHNAHRSKLIPAYLGMFKKQFHFVQHSPYLVSISKTKIETRTNTTGIIVSMIDNLYGILQFPSGTGTEKALFCAKSLFKDGWHFQGDPMKLPPMEFDGYRVPNHNRADGKEYTWYAVLVWCGRKPSPKYCSTKEDLCSSQFFQNAPFTFEDLVDTNKETEANKLVQSSHNNNSKSRNGMQIGEVLEIKRNGAVASMHKDSADRALIPGWAYRNIKFPGTFLTTTQGVGLSIGDMICFYLDPKQDAKPYTAVGCNVIILKHAQASQMPKSSGDGYDGKNKLSSKNRNKEEKGSTNGKSDNPKAKDGRRKMKGQKTRTTSTASSSGRNNGATTTDVSGDELQSSPKIKNKKKRQERNRKQSTTGSTTSGANGMPLKKKIFWAEFLLQSELMLSEEYDSEEDPTFVPPPIDDVDLDFDEYSDGEIAADEVGLVVNEAAEPVELPEGMAAEEKVESSEAEESSAKNEEVNVDGKDAADQESSNKTVKKPFWAHFLLSGDLGASEDEEDHTFEPYYSDYESPEVAEEKSEKSEGESKEDSPKEKTAEEDAYEEEIPQEELDLIIKEANDPLPDLPPPETGEAKKEEAKKEMGEAKKEEAKKEMSETKKEEAKKETNETKKEEAKKEEAKRDEASADQEIPEKKEAEDKPEESPKTEEVGSSTDQNSDSQSCQI